MEKKRTLSLTFAQTDPRECLWKERLAALPHGHFKQLIFLLLENAELDLLNDEIFKQQVVHLLTTRSVSKIKSNRAVEKQPVFEGGTIFAREKEQTDSKFKPAVREEKKDSFGSLAI